MHSFDSFLAIKSHTAEAIEMWQINWALELSYAWSNKKIEQNFSTQLLFATSGLLGK